MRVCVMECVFIKGVCDQVVSDINMLYVYTAKMNSKYSKVVEEKHLPYCWMVGRTTKTNQNSGVCHFQDTLR